MTLYLDHAFIICGAGAPEVEALTGRGFVEGSGNVHPGQGTANRRFVFSNFILELLWVVDPTEAATDAVRSTGLWERWSKQGEGASRYGIVYGGATAQGIPPPFATESYYPAYLPPSRSIEIVQGLSLDEPAIFWIPSLSADRARPTEPMDHGAPVRDICRLAIGLPRAAALSHTARRVRDAALLDFFNAPSPVLEVHLPSAQETSIDCRPDLPLVFRGTPGSAETSLDGHR